MEVFFGSEVLRDVTTKSVLLRCEAIELRQIVKFGSCTKFKPRKMYSSIK
jgi:hypothetical protein